MILGAVPREDWPQVRNKCAAMDALDGRRKEWAYHRNWVGNYLIEVRQMNARTYYLRIDLQERGLIHKIQGYNDSILVKLPNIFAESTYSGTSQIHKFSQTISKVIC